MNGKVEPSFDKLRMNGGAGTSFDRLRMNGKVVTLGSISGGNEMVGKCSNGLQRPRFLSAVHKRSNNRPIFAH